MDGWMDGHASASQPVPVPVPVRRPLSLPLPVDACCARRVGWGGVGWLRQVRARGRPRTRPGLVAARCATCKPCSGRRGRSPLLASFVAGLGLQASSDGAGRSVVPSTRPRSPLHLLRAEMERRPALLASCAHCTHRTTASSVCACVIYFSTLSRCVLLLAPSSSSPTSRCGCGCVLRGVRCAADTAASVGSW